MVVCKFTMPVTYGDTESLIPEDEWVETLDIFLLAFHGLTVTKARGGWKNSEGKFVKEEVAVVEIATDDVDLLRDYVVHMGKKFRQESVYFVVGTEAEVIDSGE